MEDVPLVFDDHSVFIYSWITRGFDRLECLTANFPEKEVASHLALGCHGAAVCTTREGLVEVGTAKAVGLRGQAKVQFGPLGHWADRIRT